jgi:hypothetical protein
VAAQSELRSGVSHLLEVLHRRAERRVAREAIEAAEQLEAALKALEQPGFGSESENWTRVAQGRLETIDALRVLRRQTSVRAAS